VSTREAFRAELRRAINKELIPPGLGNDFPVRHRVTESTDRESFAVALTE